MILFFFIVYYLKFLFIFKTMRYCLLDWQNSVIRKFHSMARQWISLRGRSKEMKIWVWFQILRHLWLQLIYRFPLQQYICLSIRAVYFLSKYENTDKNMVIHKMSKQNEQNVDTAIIFRNSGSNSFKLNL